MADAKSGQKDECDFYKAICTIRGKDHKTKGIACAVNIHGKENEEEVLLVTWKGCIGDGRNSVETVHRYWSKSKLRISKKNSEDYQLKPPDDGILNRGDFSLIRCALGDNKKGKKKWGVRLPLKYLKKEQQRGDLLAYTIRDDSYLLLNLKYDKRAERHILDIEEDLRANLILQGAPIIEGEEYFVGVLVEDEEGKVSPLFTTEGIFDQPEFTKQPEMQRTVKQESCDIDGKGEDTVDSENKVIDENRRKKLSAKVTEIPLFVYSEVCTLLNIRRVDDWKDFRMLGEKVGLKRNATEVINQRSENPTDAVLKKWSIDPAATVEKLMTLLTEMERMDVVGVLDDWMNKE